MWAEQHKCYLSLYGRFGADVCWIVDTNYVRKFEGTYAACVAGLEPRNAY